MKKTNCIDNLYNRCYILTVLSELIQLERRVFVIIIDYKDRRPIYEQVIEKFQQMILCGVLEVDSPMPSIRSLAMELSINPNTIQRAYQELERTGYIYTIKGKGSFVSETSKAAMSKRAELEAQMQELVDKAMQTGLTEKELNDMLNQSIQNTLANKGENS